METLVRAEQVNGRDPRIPYARATVLAQLGRMEEAREAVARALQIQPGDRPPAVELRGQLSGAQLSRRRALVPSLRGRLGYSARRT